jgi:uncharacterized protein
MHRPEKNKLTVAFSAGRENSVSSRLEASLIRAVCFFIALMIAPDAAFCDETKERIFETSDITIVYGQNRHHFRVELANTPATRARGLMERRTLDADVGMLFDNQKTGPIRMWMKNTFISLDMLFIDATGKIIGIASDTIPFSTKIIASPGPARAVVELNAGTAARLGLKIGDTVEHEIFLPLEN